jgi:hypothetical protein
MSAPEGLPPAAPESDSGAGAPAPEVPSATPTEADPTPGEPKTYRVNWAFLGFQDKDWAPGDTLTATDEEAAPYLGGVLTLEP